MTITVALAVLGAGALHALWNALVKNMPDQFVGFALVNLGTMVACVLAWPFIGVARGAAWPYLGASTVCHLGYELFLMGSYRRGDFSQSYPIARGAAPLFVTLGGLVVAGEHLGARSTAGVICVVVGIASLALYRSGSGRRQSHVVWALATGAAIAVYSVVDGLGVRASHDTLRYAVALLGLQSVIWVAGALARRGLEWWPASRVVAVGVAAGLLSDLGYAIVLWAQRRAPLGEVSALRETGVLWAAVIGALAFKERPLRRVALPAVAVVAGVVLLSAA